MSLALCIQETPKGVLFQTVKTQVKCCIMQHFIRVFTVCLSKKDLKTKNIIFFENYILPPLDMYNGLYRVYCIKPEGRFLQYTKGQWYSCCSCLALCVTEGCENAIKFRDHVIPSFLSLDVQCLIMQSYENKMISIICASLQKKLSSVSDQAPRL